MRYDGDPSAPLEEAFDTERTNGQELLHVQFDGCSRSYDFATPRSRQFVITEQGLFDNDGQIVAEARGGFWHARGHAFAQWDCPHPVVLTLEFQNRQTQSPQACEDGLTARGCMILAGADDVASLRNNGWICSMTHKPISRIVIDPAGFLP